MYLKKMRKIPQTESIVIGNEVYFKTSDNDIINYDLELVYKSNSDEFHFYNWNNAVYIGEITKNNIDLGI